MAPDSDSDGRISLASTADASLEEASEHEQPAAAPAAPAAAPAAPPADEAHSSGSDNNPGPRAAAHTHTAWSNDYFVLADNRNYDNMRMRIQQRWTGPDHLGPTLVSKTLVPSHYGDSRSEPDQIVLVLKAWMLYRWQGNGGRFLQRRSRLEAWARERDALARNISERGGRGSLHPKAPEQIQLWAPSVLEA